MKTSVSMSRSATGPAVARWRLSRRGSAERGGQRRRRVDVARQVLIDGPTDELGHGHALGFGRGLDLETTRRFVLMYVNDYTRDMGREGRQALEILLARAAAAGLVPPVPVIELV